jgi:hypothetical protein
MALVNHVVKSGLLREQGRHLNTQVKPLEVTSRCWHRRTRISQPESAIYAARLSMKDGKHLSDDWNNTGAWKPDRFSLKEANERLF